MREERHWQSFPYIIMCKFHFVNKMEKYCTFCEKSLFNILTIQVNYLFLQSLIY